MRSLHTGTVGAKVTPVEGAFVISFFAISSGLIVQKAQDFAQMPSIALFFVEHHPYSSANCLQSARLSSQVDPFELTFVVVVVVPTVTETKLSPSLHKLQTGPHAFNMNVFLCLHHPAFDSMGQSLR